MLKLIFTVAELNVWLATVFSGGQEPQVKEDRSLVIEQKIDKAVLKVEERKFDTLSKIKEIENNLETLKKELNNNK